MRKNQTTRTTLAPSSPSSPSLPSSPLSLSSPSPSSSSPQKSPTSSPRKNKPMLGLGFGGVPYRASVPICELKVPNEREKRDVGSSVMGGGGAAGVENDKTSGRLNYNSSSNNNQEPDTPSTNSPQTPTDISEPFSYHGDLGSGKTRTRTAVAAFDSAATMRDLNLKNSDNNKNNTDESEEDDHNDNDHNNNPNNNTKNNNNDHHDNNPSLFNPTQIPKPTFRDLEEPYGGTKHFMMAHGLKCKFIPHTPCTPCTHSYMSSLIRICC